jgi:hypothetical protein
MAKPHGEGEPAEHAAQPRGLRERQRRGEGSEEHVKDAMGVGRLEKKIAGGPVGVGSVAGLRQIDRLVDVGHGPGRGRGEHEDDREHFAGGREPRGPLPRCGEILRWPPVASSAAFVRHRSHL